MNRLNGTTIALIGGIILLLLIVAYFVTRSNGDQDKLTNGHVTGAPGAEFEEKSCASKATYELIKRDLFRRAAQLRGSDQAAFDRLSAIAVVRMENPVMESANPTTRAVNCSGSLALDLPPGVAVVGGRRTLSADVDYSVQPAADGSGTVVLLRNADPIITPLATLVRVAETVPAEANPSPDQAAPEAEQSSAAEGSVPPSAQMPTVAPSPAIRPSFNCANARTPGERAVCADPGLAALDRSMATEFGRASAAASPEERDLLRETAHRFYAYRDRCPDRQCIASAYAGRMREIRDIVEGRWQPPR